MDFIQQILEQSPHNSLGYKVSRNGLIFNKAGRKKVGQFYSRSIAYFENGEMKGKDVSLENKGAFYSGKGTNHHILPTGQINIPASNYFSLSKGFGYYDIVSNSYIEAEKLPILGQVLDNRFIKSGGSKYKFSIEELGSSAKTELVLYEKPANMTGDLFVIATELFGTGLSVADGLLLEDIPFADAKIDRTGVAFDANPLHLPIPVTAYVKNISGQKIILYYGVPVEWLDNAVYPVTIDPIITPKTESSDARIEGNSGSSWASARATGDILDTTPTVISCGIYKVTGGDPYAIVRGYFAFDTSVITLDATILDAYITMKLDKIDKTHSFVPYIIKAQWATPMSGGNMDANFDLGLSGSNIAQLPNSSGMSLGGTYSSGTFTDLTTIIVEGETRLACLTSHDKNNTYPGGTSGIAAAIKVYSGNHGTAGDRVFMTVEYELPATAGGILTLVL